MAEFIDREEIYKAMSKLDWQDLYLPSHFKDIIDEIPAADVAPVKREKWIERKDDDSYPCPCSECGFVPFGSDYVVKSYFHYCPNCGAKMD